MHLEPVHTPLPKRTAWQIQRAVIFALMLRELKTRVEGRWLGTLWLLFEPLAHVLVMLALFGFIRHVASPGVEYPVFLVTGLMPFFIFRNLALQLMAGIDVNRALFAYRQVRPIDALLARGLVELGLHSIVFALALALLGWQGYHFLPAKPLEVLLALAVLTVLGTSLGILLAVMTNARPKLRSVVNLAFMPLYFASGVIFSLQVLPQSYRNVLLWNPVLHLIEYSRAAFLPQYRPLAGTDLLYPTTVALVLAALSLSVYRVSRQKLLASV